MAWTAVDHPHLYICECSDRRCRERVRVTGRTYAKIAADGLLLQAPGHRQTGERLVRRGDGWNAVRPKPSPIKRRRSAPRGLQTVARRSL